MGNNTFERRLFGKFTVYVKWIVVAGKVGESLNIFRGDRMLELRTVANTKSVQVSNYTITAA